MKYHNENQINRIHELDYKIAIKMSEIRTLSRESESLTEELRNEHGGRFYAFGRAYVIVTKRREGEPDGDRYYLASDESTKIIT